MISQHLFKAPCGAPLFPSFARGLLQLVLASACVAAFAADIAPAQRIATDFRAVEEAVIEAVEAEGLVVSATLPFARMLERTAGAVGRQNSPLSQAVIIQFCSARLAWQLIEEEPAQVALCPLAIVIFSSVAEPDIVLLTYRLPGQETPGRIAAEALLKRIIGNALELARY
jgi:uncharacterized protein (DUF302 family)